VPATTTGAGSVVSLDDAVDHVRGTAGRLVLEYGDYECPYARAAYRAMQRVERVMGDEVRFAYRHFPLTQIHPHALAAAAAAEAAALQGRFWEMSDLLFAQPKGLEDRGLRAYAARLGLDLASFDADRRSAAVRARIARDVASGLESRQVHGTPTLFVDGVLHDGDYDVESLLEVLYA
jgi:protein-disulfide isomerase